MIPFKIAGNGTYQPELTVPSSQLDKKFGKQAGWTEKKFGIKKRSVANSQETSSVMGAAAAQKALEKAGWDARDLDVIIGACGVMEQPIPSTSVLIQQHMGLGNSGIPTFDVNLTCLSFLSAFDVATMGISCGRWKKILIVSSDIASAGLDYSVPETASIFGDGAAAICLEATMDQNGPGMLSRGFETYGDAHKLAVLRAGGTRLRVEEGYDAIVKGSYFEMDTFGIFKAAAKCLPDLIDRTLEQAGYTRETIDFVVCHQASAPAVEHIRRMFKPAPDKVVNIFSEVGNQIATSIPTVLSHTLDHGLVKAGQSILLLGTAAGVSAGTIVLRV
ncbi:MAG: 3-oxoacyl-[acyl-carrier-protein] synthase III C-terminal domain-containing protein [Alphaproteobacteria bacterium]